MNRVDDYNKRKTGLCFGLKTSKTPQEDYQSLLKFYTNSISANERRLILNSLGCISNSTILKTYLSELLSNDSVISRADVKYVYRAVTLNNYQGIEVTLPFLNQYLPDILEKFSGLITLSDILLEPARWIASVPDLEQLGEIVEKHKSINGMEVIGKKVLDLSYIHNHWFGKNRNDITLILSKMTHSSSDLVVPSTFLIILCMFFVVKA